METDDNTKEEKKIVHEDGGRSPNDGHGKNGFLNVDKAQGISTASGSQSLTCMEKETLKVEEPQIWQDEEVNKAHADGTEDERQVDQTCSTKWESLQWEDEHRTLSKTLLQLDTKLAIQGQRLSNLDEREEEGSALGCESHKEACFALINEETLTLICSKAGTRYGRRKLSIQRLAETKESHNNHNHNVVSNKSQQKKY